MSIFKFLRGLLQAGADDSVANVGTGDGVESASRELVVNPATGLPMQSGLGGVDVAGSPYGFDFHHTSAFSDNCSVASNGDCGFDSGIGDCSFNDPFGQ